MKPQTNHEALHREQIAAFLRQGEKSAQKLCVGLEAEHFLVDRKTKCTLGYTQTRSILEALQPYYTTSVAIDGLLMGLTRADAAITLEPSCQFEVSLAPASSLHTLKHRYHHFLQDLLPLLDAREIDLVYTGYLPCGYAAAQELIPKFRYRWMDRYLSRTGTMAKHMMRATCSVQIALDYTSETDFTNKLRTASLLSPVFAYLMDNCPLFENKPNTMRMTRWKIWENVDAKRCGIVPGVFDEDFGYDAYAECVLQTPLIVALDQQGTMIYAAEQSAKTLYDPKIPLTQAQIEHILSMVFYHVRAKRYLEIRPADCVPEAFLFAYAALIKGLFYNPTSFDALCTKLRAYQTPQVFAQTQDALRSRGSLAHVFDMPLTAFLRFLYALALDGLPEEERALLHPLSALCDNALSAGEFLRKFPDAICRNTNA